MESAKRTVGQIITDRVGFLPRDALGWLYVSRGFYKAKEYHLVVESVNYCLRHERTVREAQHLLAFSLLHTGQTELATSAFLKSVLVGNETDWQPLIELCIENPEITFQKPSISLPTATTSNS